MLACLPHHLPAHPPLTSLRLFAPPYASEGGGTSSPPFAFTPSPPFAERKGARGMHHCLPPSWSVRGLGGCLPAMPPSPPRASPAHIAPLVRAPLRKRRGRTLLPFAECEGETGDALPSALKEAAIVAYHPSHDTFEASAETFRPRYAEQPHGRGIRALATYTPGANRRAPLPAPKSRRWHDRRLCM